MTTLLIADNENGTVSASTMKALTAAAGIGAEVHVLVTGPRAAEAAASAATKAGVSRVRYCESPALLKGLAEPLSAFIVSLAGDYDTIMAPSSSSGKNVMPRVAALLDVMQISDVSEVIDARTFKRPIYAGNAILTVQSTDPVRVLTVRGASFAAAGSGPAAPVEQLQWDGSWSGTEHVSASAVQSERPDLSAARIIISGGRAFGSKEKFDALLPPLADKLGAAIGASRAAVDAGYAANDLQVGQTGRIVAPELYIACGISGAIQHLAGIKDARVIVAINKDPEAPIFQIADYGLVGDIFALLPELKEAL